MILWSLFIKSFSFYLKYQRQINKEYLENYSKFSFIFFYYFNTKLLENHYKDKSTWARMSFFVFLFSFFFFFLSFGNFYICKSCKIKIFCWSRLLFNIYSIPEMLMLFSWWDSALFDYIFYSVTEEPQIFWKNRFQNFVKICCRFLEVEYF